MFCVLTRWVSGVSRVTHPVVWAAVLHYRHSCVLQERVGELCLCLVYTATQTHPSLFEFTNCGIEDQLFSCCTARRDLQVVCGTMASFSKLVLCNEHRYVLVPHLSLWSCYLASCYLPS